MSDKPWLSAAQEGRKMDAGVWFHRTVAVFPFPETTEAEKRLKRPHEKSLKLLTVHFFTVTKPIVKEEQNPHAFRSLLGKGGINLKIKIL